MDWPMGCPPTTHQSDNEEMPVPAALFEIKEMSEEVWVTGRMAVRASTKAIHAVKDRRRSR